MTENFRSKLSPEELGRIFGRDIPMVAIQEACRNDEDVERIRLRLEGMGAIWQKMSTGIFEGLTPASRFVHDGSLILLDGALLFMAKNEFHARDLASLLQTGLQVHFRNKKIETEIMEREGD